MRYLGTRKRDEKRDDKREEKRDAKHRKSRSVSKSSRSSYSSVEEVKAAKFVLPDIKAITALDPGDFKNFPEVTPRTVESLIKRGINSLFPVQYESFNKIWSRQDLIIRDLTGSGKTLAFALPLVEYLRKNKCFGSGKIQGIVLAPTRELAL